MYDLIDFGSGKGGCIKYAQTKLHVSTHLGVELQQARVSELKKHGFNCIQGDVTKIKLPKRSAKIVTISHLLEHLESYAEVEKCIAIACRLAQQCVMIESPCFDFDKYLRAKKLKFYWSDWHGHRVKYTCTDLLRTLKRSGIAMCDFLVEYPLITSSSDPTLHGLASPIDQFSYNPKRHPPKPQVALHSLFKSYIIFAWKSVEYREPAYLHSHAKFRFLKNYTFVEQAQ